jgi:hypothetical protein
VYEEREKVREEKERKRQTATNRDRQSHRDKNIENAR